MTEDQVKEKEGWAWVQVTTSGLRRKTPICVVKELKRGKNKRKLEVTLCRGRHTDGSIIRGTKKIIPFNHLIEFPQEVL